MDLGSGVSHVVQNVIFPGLVFDAPPEMYVRINPQVRLHLSQPLLVFTARGRASFDTFYNGLTVGAWQGQCDIHNLSLNLHGTGSFLLRIGLHRYGYARRWLDEREISLSEGESFNLVLPFWPQLADGMLYFSVEALGPATLTGGSFETTSPARRDVRLGLVITHFRRKQFVVPAIQRIREHLQNAGLNREIKLIVVDNSQDITFAEARGAVLIPNRNLGGSGGFMRGLLYLQDNGFSHCLFMDDDASCEVDSILRCAMLLKFAKSDQLAVAGSLLREAEPYRISEKGARFDGICRPLKQGFDMRHVPDLLGAEHLDVNPDYGGWWFFAFAISSVKHFAFPFFVRGDDIQFSTLNKFAILTINGIASWGEDFSLKSGPLTEYLDVRYHIMQNLCIRMAGRLALLRMLCRFFFFHAFSYNYARAQAVTLAMQDVMKGPDFWVQDMNMQHKRSQIQSFSAGEVMSRLDRDAVSDLQRLSEYEPPFRRLMRIITLNGFLLPSIFLHDGLVFQHKGFTGALRNVFRFRRVLYEHEPSQTGYICHHDKRRFFGTCFEFIKTLARFAFSCSRLRADYRKQLPAMTSETFWRQVYATELAETVLAPAGASGRAVASVDN
jgi:galactofuranosylgalactofuranosylrhamnosyl-N-acetylglucosaminyl-diphospho-decaprenol beta-1,5/1,6-galactofuranosyltransferase